MESSEKQVCKIWRKLTSSTEYQFCSILLPFSIRFLRRSGVGRTSLRTARVCLSAISRVYWLWDIRYTAGTYDMVRGCCLEYTFAYPSSKLYVITVARSEMLAKIFPSTSMFAEKRAFLRNWYFYTEITLHTLHLPKENIKRTPIYRIFYNQ